MRESCFTSEVYALYAIGSLDGEDLTEIESHTRSGCEVCRQELLQARRLWFMFASSAPSASPRPELKQRVMAAIQPARLRVVTPPPRRSNWWMQAIAAALLLATGIGVGWKLHRPPSAPSGPLRQIVQAPPSPAPAPDQTGIEKLQAQIADLNARLKQQADQLAAGASLEKTVAALQAEAAGRARILQDAQDHAAQLQSEAQRLRDKAAAADARAHQAEQQFQTASAERKQAQDRESSLRNEYAARIRQLENENAKFQRVIDDQQRKLQQNQQLVAFYSSPNLRFRQYKGTRSGPDATAHVVEQEGSRVVFYAFHLPQLPAGRTYQLWLIRGQSPAIVSGGIFKVDAQGNAVVEFSNPAMIRDVRQFAVTDEPGGGSPGPTGNQFFRAS